MALVAPRHWQDWANVLLGVWMFLSPPILGMSVGGSAATPTAVAFGAAIIIFSCMAVYMPRAWEEIINILLGIGLAVSPWALGYVGQNVGESRATVNAVIVGLLVTGLAIWAMLTNTDMQKWWHDRHLPH
jgi:hypothetical protein